MKLFAIQVLRAAIGAYGLATLVLLGGCAAGREIHWNEVVQASTGEVFTVRRREERKYVTEPGQKGGWLFEEATLEADVPGIGMVHWQTSLRPWLLDRARDGRWYIIAMRGSYASQYEYGLFDGRRMGPHFVFYRHRAGDWERILAKDLPPEFATPNLLIYGSSILEPDLHGPYLQSNPNKMAFQNGQLLDLALKTRVNVPSHPADDSWRFRLIRDWRLDHGERQLTECVTGGPCDAECWKHGGPCKSVNRFDVGQSLGRSPKSVEVSR